MIREKMDQEMRSIGFSMQVACVYRQAHDGVNLSWTTASGDAPDR